MGAAAGEAFIVLHESGNDHDRHEMAVYCDEDPGVIVGHLPRKILKTCDYFTRHEGKISGKVTGHRIYRKGRWWYGSPVSSEVYQ